MGFSWAVRIVQTVMKDILNAPPPAHLGGCLGSDRRVADGTPLPRVLSSQPVVRHEYIDDYGIVEQDFEGVDPSRSAFAQREAARGLVGNACFDVQEDTVGDSARTIGADFSGSSLRPNQDKMWLAKVAAEEIVRLDTIEPAVVERCFSILT